MQLLLVALVVALAAAVRVVFRRRYRSLSHIRGPSSPSWLFGASSVLWPVGHGAHAVGSIVGHDISTVRQKEVGEQDFKWMREYGPTWRIASHLGVRLF